MKPNFEGIKIYLNKRGFKILYYRYQEYLTPLFVILASILLFTTVVITQFQGLLSSQNQIGELSMRIAALEKNIKTVSQINDASQDSSLQMVVSALPSEKDFAGILNAVASASNKSGVSVGDYVFQVGDLSTSTAKASSSLTLTLTIQGDAVAMKRFLKVLSKTSPISNVRSLSTNRFSSTVVISFYFTPANSIKIDYTKPIATLSAAELEVLQKIQGFDNSQNLELNPRQSSASAAL